MYFNYLANKPALRIVTMSMTLAVSTQAIGGPLFHSSRFSDDVRFTGPPRSDPTTGVE